MDLIDSIYYTSNINLSSDRTNSIESFNRFGYYLNMKITKVSGATTLHVHIATNGDRLEKYRICKEASISETTLNKILRGHNPKWEVRYRIYQATGIKLVESDDFPERLAS